MTNQEAFDKVVRHLFTQKARSLEKYEGRMRCLYRSSDGKKCAIGALIPDEEYKTSFETRRVFSIQPEVPTLSSLDFELLSELQKIHDTQDLLTWGSSLYDLAKRLELDPSVLEEFV